MIKILKTKIDKSFEKGPLRRSLFNNGVVSLFHEFKGMKSASVNLYFLAGSIFEDESNQGIAHLIEHMLFKEEKTSSLLKELELFGASINAYTYKEYVCFELDCSAKKLEQFLPSFLDLFLNPLFLPKSLSKEKKIVIQELREDKDNHELIGLETLFEKTFDFKIGHNIGGTPKIVKTLDTNDLHRYYKKYFTPNRMILSVASGKKFDKLEAIIARSFPSHSKDLKPWRFSKVKKELKLKSYKGVLKRPIQSSMLFLSFAGVSLSSKDYYAYCILDDLLFEGIHSLFYQAFREKRPLVYGLGSDLHSFVDGGCYLMIFNSLRSNIPLIKENIFTELISFQKNLTQEMIVNIQERLIERWELNFDSLHERNEFIAHSEIYSDNDFSLKKQIESLKSINSKDIRRILDKIINDNYSQLIIGA